MLFKWMDLDQKKSLHLVQALIFLVEIYYFLEYFASLILASISIAA
jgi:hypothetical protein